MNGWKWWVRQYVARIVRYGLISGTDKDGYDNAKGREKDPSEPDYQVPVRRLQHYGFRSRPPKDSEGIFLSVNGGAGNKVLIATDSTKYGPTDQAEEEVEVYCSKGQRISLDEDGQITISAKNATIKIDQNGKVTIDAAAGQDVVVNGGSQPVARKNDPVGYIGVTTVMGAVTAVVWSPTPVPPPAVSTPIYIQDGALHFKA